MAFAISTLLILGILAALWLSGFFNASTPASHATAHNGSTFVATSSSDSPTRDGRAVHAALHGIALTIDQRRALEGVVEPSFAAYTSGKYSTVCDGITALRKQVPAEWQNVDLESADASLAWFYSTLSYEDGEVMARVLTVGRHDDLQSSVRQAGRNSGLGIHATGFAALDQHDAVRTVCEVARPVRYQCKDGRQHKAKLSIIFLWNPTAKDWTQVGNALYDFPVGSTFPMIPY
jgi:hypothetical protein